MKLLELDAAPIGFLEEDPQKCSSRAGSELGDGAVIVKVNRKRSTGMHAPTLTPERH